MKARSEPGPGRLLVVDDNKVNRLLLARGLQEQGHDITFAENGRQALDTLRQASFDLVLLDIMMPELDGYQVLEEITTDSDLRDIPVIVVSAMDELDSVVKCIEMGAEDYLSKPLNPVLLKARIGACLEKKWLRDQQRELISKFATSEVAEDLLATGFALGGKYVEASAMFSDIRGFTTISESQSPEDTIELLNTYYTLMFDAISGHEGVVNQIVGDGLMAIFGAPASNPEHARCAVDAALEMVELVELFNQEQASQGKLELQIGVGVATGQLIAGYTGTQNRATYTCVGDAVNVAARLESHTKSAGHSILIDENTHIGLKGAIQDEDLGLVDIKGKKDKVRVFAIPLASQAAGD